MISHKYKFIYSHIPKAAGTTVENALKSYASKTFGRNAEKKWLRNKKLFDAFEIHNDYYKFSFARNPWDRLVSCYVFFSSTHSIINSSFVDFIKSIDLFLREDNRPELHYYSIQNNTCADGLSGVNIKAPSQSPLLGYHVLPQAYFIRDDFNFIGKVENLQEDFNIICDKIGIPRQGLPQKNKTNHKHYTEYYDDETKQIVAEKYAKDIEYFGYKFGE
jgi:chondroitin 4-sulfotransferase 11